MSWRMVADFCKKHPITLKVADRMGRGHGRTRFLDCMQPAPPASGQKPDLSDWQSRKLSAVWIGHATLLLRLGDLTILTDPVFSRRVGLGLGVCTLGPQRWTSPALAMDELPPIDLILLSHAHYDHLDLPSLARLDGTAEHPGPRIITASHMHDLLGGLHFSQVDELKWNQSIQIGAVKITAIPVKHWGARTFIDLHRGYNAYLLEAAGQRVLYGGDTAFHEGFASVGPVDLAILGIGAYDPYIAAHATPEQAWTMAMQVKAAAVLPMHHSTFKLSHEPMTEPIERFLTAAGNELERVVIRQIGQQWIAP